MRTEQEINDYLVKVRAKYGEPEKEVAHTVDLIPAAWEWICPNCFHYQRVIEWTERVTCANCHKTYSVSEADHAWG